MEKIEKIVSAWRHRTGAH